MKLKYRPFILWIAFALLAQGVTAQGEERDLTMAMAQTLSALSSITVRDYFVASRWNRPGETNIVEFQSLTPFKAWDQENLMRLNIPFRTASDLGPGLSDVRLFDLVMLKTGVGFWGVGPVFNLGIYRGPGIDAFQAGPATTFVFTHSPWFSFGFLNQNFFSSQVALSTFQPIFVYRPTRVFTLSLGELPLVYNWKQGSFAVFSMGFQIGATANLAGQPVRLFLNPQYNTKSSTELYKWTIASGITLPLKPSGH